MGRGHGHGDGVPGLALERGCLPRRRKKSLYNHKW